MRKVLLVLSFLGFMIEAHAQYTKNQIISFLTNGSHRDWLLGKYKSKGNNCHGSGRVFTFFNNGTVQISTCLNGKPQTQTIKYEIVPGGVDGNDGLDFSVFIELDSSANSVRGLNILFDLPEINVSGKKLTLYNPPNAKSNIEESYDLISLN